MSTAASPVQQLLEVTIVRGEKFVKVGWIICFVGLDLTAPSAGILLQDDGQC